MLYAQGFPYNAHLKIRTKLVIIRADKNHKTHTRLLTNHQNCASTKLCALITALVYNCV